MTEGEELSEAMERFERNIEREVTKLKYYLEPADELIEQNDYVEMEIAVKQGTQIIDKITDLISQLEGMKLDSGVSPRDVRQWKKDKKNEFSPLVQEKIKLSETLSAKQKQEEDEIERANWETRREREERVTREKQEQEKQFWEEKFRAELRVAEQKLEMETAAKATHAKLPKLKITPFKGTPTDWVRFENMFVTQVHDKPITPEEKFGYLLEMVTPTVRGKIGNLKPSEIGYKRAWERLKTEYGQNKLVVNAHVQEIVNLPSVRGTHFIRIQEFYENLSKNYDALVTMGEADMLQGFVISTLNKLPHVKPDLVRTDDNWESWRMEHLINNLQGWLKRNRMEEQPGTVRENHKRERLWYAAEGEEKQPSDTTKSIPVCLYCQKGHWGDRCETYKTLESRRKFLTDNRLCYNCGRGGHIGHRCRSRGCFNCKGRHHTSICDRKENPVLTVYTPSAEETLPAIIPVKINGTTLWAYLDTGSGRNFISEEAIKRLQLNPVRHETRQIVTLSGTQKQSMPIFDLTIDSVDGQARERIEVTGAKMADFTTIRRPNLSTLKWKYEHTKDKRFYKNTGDDYTIHLILGDSTYCRIRTEDVFKGKPGEPIVEGTTFGWVIHGGDRATDGCLYIREASDYERLYSLDVLGVEDRGESSQLDVHAEFNENISRNADGRYEVNVPWIPGRKLAETNEIQSRQRLRRVEKKLEQNMKLKEEYEKIVANQEETGVIEKVPDHPTGTRVFYMPHKPVIREDAATTKVRMVFDACAKPHYLANSINDCMYRGPPLQPLMWDILIRARMSTDILLGDIEKAFLQVGIKEEDRDAFRFLFKKDGKEEHFRFTRVPFGAEASPFILGATLQYHCSQQPEEVKETVQALRENTYVDNLMQTGQGSEEMKRFKTEATQVLEEARFPVHKWESNLQELESDGMANPSKIQGLGWDKQNDTIEVTIPQQVEEEHVTKKTILSHLGSIYDPLGILSPTTVEGKRIYREACDEKNGWNGEISDPLKKQWTKWTKQLKSVTVPRSIMRNVTKTKTVHLHIFADASNLACCAAAIAVVEHSEGMVKGLLTSKSRISKRDTTIARLELVGGQMAANLAKNLHNALRGWPLGSITVWMDSMVALYWILNPGKSWKVFVENRVRKMAQITEEVGIEWKYCPTARNLADLGSRGAPLNKMGENEWYEGPTWLLTKEDWPPQPIIRCTPKNQEEEKPLKEIVAYTREEVQTKTKELEEGSTENQETDEWDELLSRNTYWRALRITAWALRFSTNSHAQSKKRKKISGPLSTGELAEAKRRWAERAQKGIPDDLKKPGWELVKDKETNLLKCKGRIQGYNPVYLEDTQFTRKLIQHVHTQIQHLGVANTMATLREEWWIPRLRTLVKKEVRDCNVCKVFAAKPYGAPTTSALPEFRTNVSRPFQYVGVDFAGPLKCKEGKTEEEKAYVLIFTCATSRAVHLELTRSQTAEEFQRKLNAFITRRTRPEKIISDNAATFKVTATWIKRIRKSEKLQNYLAQQEITWQFNLSKSPWWGGMYERLIKEVKKTAYKTLGNTHLTFQQLEVVIMDIEKHLNNRPLTYVESEEGEPQTLTPNILMWGQNAYDLEDIEVDEEEVTKLHRRLKNAREHAWSRWQNEYVHSLMEAHRVNRRGKQQMPEIGESRNRGEWKKGKVVQLIKGRDGVVRGVVLLHNGNRIRRPLQLVCPLEIRSCCKEPAEENESASQEPIRSVRKRKAADDARARIKLIAEQDSNGH